MSVKDKTKALAIHCIDFRFQKQIEKDLEKRGLFGQFDRIAWPGASRDFENVKKTAQLSIKLHNPDKIFIYEHEGCGAYGQDNSLNTHRKNAQRLKTFLKKTKPKIKITTLVATFEGIKKL